MRELKFRAWDRHGSMFYQRPDTVTDHGVVFQLPQEDGLPENERVWYPPSLVLYDPQRWEVMQYIGLKDRAGKEIYEGDIVKWGDLEGGEERPVRIAVVEIDPDIRFRQMNGNKHVFHFSTFYYRETEKWLEVIGNIHQNPELLVP